MSAIVTTTLDHINELYSQIANLPEAVPGGEGDKSITTNLKQSFESTLHSLSEFREWETKNQKKAKLIRESHTVEVQRNTMKAALKFVKRAMQVKYMFVVDIGAPILCTYLFLLLTSLLSRFSCLPLHKQIGGN